MNTASFAARHLGIRPSDLPYMLEVIGVDQLDQLIDETVPEGIRLNRKLELDSPMSEFEFLEHIHALGKENKLFKTFIGTGYHPTITPSVIKRNILENPGWYTAYTPYQAEIAQGRLEALVNYQTMICDLTGMELANASLLDEGTAAAEAMTMLFDLRSRDQKNNHCVNFFVSEGVLPQTLAVLKTRSTPLGINIVTGKVSSLSLDASYYGALLQYPDLDGGIHSYENFITEAHELEIKVAVATDPLSLCILTPPGEWGADVVVGSTQRFGIPMGYGGPHAAFFATREEYKRSIPGRIIGLSKDIDGKPAYRMALQTREQHIKRDKATSNICTAQVLLAVMAGAYGVFHGPEGLRDIAYRIHGLTASLASVAKKLGIGLKHEAFFDTLCLEINPESIRKSAEEAGINLGYALPNHISISLNETTTLEDVEMLSALLAKAQNKTLEFAEVKPVTAGCIPEDLQRKSGFMQQEVFNRYHSETEMMRYLKKLERKDLALNQSMISLGSCTMKLNAATEMLPLSMPEWGSLHPFVPLNQAIGYQKVLSNLESYLCEVTGFAATSLQPNSGAQGEYAGLMLIRAYHESRGEGHRNICLIPASAHGTNPASAVMAGMQVVVTKTDEKGNIDLADLKEKVLLHSEALSALMVTYPSTHGVFESAIKEITKLIHEHGGQVYMDGANMNAQVGLTNPATIGADVCHLNLHKTFAIPHGGGGPGVGPVCVAPQLAPFLPKNPVIATGGNQGIPAISAAPWGSALVCLISYAYIKMLGAEGLTDATRYAILNANYMKERLAKAYPILYTGENGRAAHEMIVDCREFKKWGVEVTDIAKRLMDYGFHAPTVSFPVAGTLMIEPTESESLEEIDRFCDAMLAIRKEIDASTAAGPNPILKNAPHTLAMITSDSWEFEYSRAAAAYPLPYVAENKFWPGVRRIDDAYGDRNLICTCTPVEAYAETEE
ncbi:MAG: hypothetical protein RLZZ241_543 [Bacteroidota bacterium]|jgi:glycine dehydrogenase